jgi:hypothetical protein
VLGALRFKLNDVFESLNARPNINIPRGKGRKIHATFPFVSGNLRLEFFVKTAEILLCLHWLDYGLDNLGITVQLPTELRVFYFLFRIQTGNGVQPAY